MDSNKIKGTALGKKGSPKGKKGKVLLHIKKPQKVSSQSVIILPQSPSEETPYFATFKRRLETEH